MPQYIDDVYIQKRCIAYIACKLGEDMVYTAKGSKRKTRLTALSIEARNAICGTITIDKNRFRMWVEEKLIPTLGNYALGEPRSVVIMDNATIHAGVRELIRGAGAKLIYLSAYSPELNPIELMFGMYKSYLKRHQDVNFSTAHSNALQCVSPDIARALFKHSRVPGCEHFLSHLEVKYLEQQYGIIATSIVASVYSLLMMAMNEDDDEEEP